MSRVVRNIFLVIFTGVVLFNFIVVTLSVNGASWLNEDWSVYFKPTRENFMGIEFWFDKISSFKGLGNTLKTIRTAVRLFNKGGDIASVWYYVTTPFQLVWNFIIDLINSIIWLFSLFDPYNNFTGFVF